MVYQRNLKPNHSGNSWPDQTSSGRPQQSVSEPLSNDGKEDIRQIILHDPTGERLVQFASKMGPELAKGKLSRSQIRNIFGEARRIEAIWDKDSTAAFRSLNLLIPKLEYLVARENKEESIRRFAGILTEAILHIGKAADREQAFEKFMNLFEALLAYHRSAGGK